MRHVTVTPELVKAVRADRCDVCYRVFHVRADRCNVCYRVFHGGQRNPATVTAPDVSGDTPMEVKPMEKRVHELINKAATAPRSEDAMRYSQAACNAANALTVLADVRTKPKG